MSADARAESVAAPASRPRGGALAAALRQREVALLAVLLTIGLLVTLENGRFASASNLQDVALSAAVLVVLASAMALPLLTRNLDLSVASVLGLREGIGVVQLVTTGDGAVAVLGAAARVPGGHLAELVRYAVGIDLVELALRFALGEAILDDAVRPRRAEPVALRYLTAAPGQLPTGRVGRIGALGPVLSAEGVVAAETYLSPGDVVRPLRTAADRYGHVIATGPTREDADRSAADAAAAVAVEMETPGAAGFDSPPAASA